MTENQVVYHQTINGKYRVVIERAATAKGILGYKIEANNDDITAALADAQELKNKVEAMTPMPVESAPAK